MAQSRTARRPLSKKAQAEKAARAAEREQATEALHQQLTEAVLQLATSEGWTAMLDKLAQRAGTEIGRYSFANMITIMMQCPQATAVCSFKQWKERGRQVRKGEKAIRIWAPMTGVRRDERTGEPVTNDQGEEKRWLRFKLVPVFDISQTEPLWQEGPVFTITPSVFVPKFGGDVQGEAPAQMWEDLADLVERQGYRVEVDDTGRSDGWTHKGSMTVRISDRSPQAHAAVTLAHEVAGHIGCGHMEGSHDEYRQHRGRMEVEAESVAYMVAARYGVDAEVTSAPYIAGWAGKDPKEVERLLTATGETVRKAYRTFLESVEGTGGAQPVPAAQEQALAAA
ncbi:ArdC-like ssDNA-binding domain-containing protein [Kitasatospora sp. NPDC093679]|uniref:ArdC-like ssDNA-binding domain-containing protein n=1 Tax=Kitasatospora sp. NPDC093679 TaxID=3154983 RepID=UPI00342D2DC4